MLKKILMFGGVFLALLLVLSPVLAEEAANTNGENTTSANPVSGVVASEKIACVKNAISVREAAIAAAVATHAQGVQAAYATRANELAGAYSNTTVKAIKAGVKVAWADFKKSIKSATDKWRTSRNAAWTAYKASVKACKAPAGVSDSGNSGLELNGQ